MLMPDQTLMTDDVQDAFKSKCCAAGGVRVNNVWVQEPATITVLADLCSVNDRDGVG